MTTYTLTAEQLHNLMALIYDSVSTNPKWIADREYAAQMLRSLQPNTQEPVDFDVWQENPYTKVLMKSIKDDYVPKHNTQEPVAWWDTIDGADLTYSVGELMGGSTDGLIPLFTHPAPQQKLWQDLTVQEQAEATSKFGHVWSIDMIGIADAISAKLQEKNGHLHPTHGVKL